MPDEKIVESIELLIHALVRYPLNKEALFYKIYLLTIQRDTQTALETAETLRVFYPDDSSAIIVAAHTLACANKKIELNKFLKKHYRRNR